MPIQIEEAKTPKGRRMMLAKVSGHVSMADAEAMGAAPAQPARPTAAMPPALTFKKDRREMVFMVPLWGVRVGGGWDRCRRTLDHG